MALFQYFFQVIYQLFGNPDGFSEWRLIFAYQLFVFSLLLPFVTIRTKKNANLFKPNNCIFIIIKAFIIILSLTFFKLISIYTSIYIDGFVSITAAVAFAHALNHFEPVNYRNIVVFLTCSVLVLSKDVGLFYATFAIITNCVTQFANKPSVESSRSTTFPRVPNMRNIIFTLMSFSAVVLPKLLWKLRIHIDKARIRFDDPYDFSMLIDIITGKDTSYRSHIIPGFFGKILTDRYTVGDYSLPFMVVLIILLIGLICTIPRVNAQSNSKLAKTNSIYISILATMSLFYILGLPVTYIFKFDAREAANYASLDRYAGILSSCLWVLFVLSYLSANDNLEEGKKHTVVFFTLIFLFAKRPEFEYYLSRNHVSASIHARGKYDVISQQLHSCAGDNATNIHIIDQKSDGYTLYLSYYNFRPYSVNSNWRLGSKPLFEGDIWTELIPPNDWKQLILDEYDYVVIYTTDDYFTETYSDFFEEGITEYCVYKVDKSKRICRIVQ